MARLSFQQEFQVLKDVSLGAISIFTSVLAIIATARLLPQDVEDRIVYTILAKAVPRFEYLIGKLLGVLVLLAISTAVMAALFLVVLYAREQSALADAAHQPNPAEAIRLVREAGIHPNLALAQWSALSEEQRYVLLKLSEARRSPEKFNAALRELRLS